MNQMKQEQVVVVELDQGQLNQVVGGNACTIRQHTFAETPETRVLGVKVGSASVTAPFLVCDTYWD